MYGEVLAKPDVLMVENENTPLQLSVKNTLRITITPIFAFSSVAA